MGRKLTREEVTQMVSNYVNAVRENGFDVVSAVLFGSRARGVELVYSDVDLLLVLSNCSYGFVERIEALSKFWRHELSLEVFPYTKDEVMRLFKRGSITLYDSLEHGIIIYDDGFFSSLRRLFAELVGKGVIRRGPNGWWMFPEPDTIRIQG
ncbi:MAG: nucleotidyltransferase domain-containing protein [Candidatus Caldarchaeum sp.]